MDCNGFVKIGVSKNVDKRKDQIPYDVKQYYCTEPLENAYEIERNMHRFFLKFRVDEVSGIEYFSIGFSTAVEVLKNMVVADNDRAREFSFAISEIEKGTEDVYIGWSKMMLLSDKNLNVIFMVIEALSERNETNVKKVEELTEGTIKEV